jgi:hypothetical protein
MMIFLAEIAVAFMAPYSKALLQSVLRFARALPSLLLLPDMCLKWLIGEIMGSTPAAGREQDVINGRS